MAHGHLNRFRVRPGVDQEWREGLGALTVQPSMCDLVDGFSTRARGQVPHAECQMVEIEPSVLPFRESEDEAEGSARRRKVDLDASGETSSVPRFLVAGEKRVDSLTLSFQPEASFLGDPLRAARCLAQILVPGQLVESDLSEAPLDWHAYPSPSGGFTAPYSASNSARVAGSWPKRSMMA
jgi:hypothetical protein